MAIVLVRHGETAGNATRVLQTPELPLNELGVRQAQCLAERLASMRVSHILCSDLKRAQMTAAPIAERLGLTVESTPLLAERSFGDLRGTPYSQLRSDPFAPDFAPPNGETWAAFYERVAQAFALIVARRASTQGDLLVVTHGLVCRALLQQHIPATAAVTATFGNTGVTLLDDVAPYSAQLVDCCCHLDATTTRVGPSGAA
jgi:broad specificity phosphatase PhoE